MRLWICAFIATLAVGCGQSDEELCEDYQEPSCPSGKEALPDSYDICLDNLEGPCGDEYRELVTCEIDHPICHTKKPDGSLAFDGEITCGDERDKFLGCARPYVE